MARPYPNYSVKQFSSAEEAETHMNAQSREGWTLISINVVSVRQMALSIIVAMTRGGL
jgi:hypothetical protein